MIHTERRPAPPMSAGSVESNSRTLLCDKKGDIVFADCGSVAFMEKTGCMSCARLLRRRDGVFLMHSCAHF